MKKKDLWPLLFGIALFCFTLYLVLDTFVIRRTYQADITQMNMSLFENVSETEDWDADPEENRRRPSTDRDETPGEDGRRPSTDRDEDPDKNSRKPSTDRDEDPEENRRKPSTDRDEDPEENRRRPSTDRKTDRPGYDRETSDQDTEWPENDREPVDLSEPLTYRDDHIRITLTEYQEYDTHIYVADVRVSSAEYLKTAFAEDTYGSNITAPTSEIAEDHGAILAINGDYYGSQEKGYVIRNGVVYRDRGNGKYIACIFADGHMDIVHCEDYDADELVEMGVWQEFCFGPGLISDDEILVEDGDEVKRAKTSNPRTAIGMIEPNHFLFVVSDGRSDESVGLTLLELAEFMHGLGAVTAYNLDGGGSSTMVFQGTVINNPSSGISFDERSVSDIVYIG